MNKYTFHINSERISVPPTVVNVNATTLGRAWKQVEQAFPWKGIFLRFINDVPYVPEEDNDDTNTYYGMDPEEKYWAAAATYAERNSYDID